MTGNCKSDTDLTPTWNKHIIDSMWHQSTWTGLRSGLSYCSFASYNPSLCLCTERIPKSFSWWSPSVRGNKTHLKLTTANTKVTPWQRNAKDSYNANLWEQFFQPQQTQKLGYMTYKTPLNTFSVQYKQPLCFCMYSSHSPQIAKHRVKTLLSNHSVPALLP